MRGIQDEVTEPAVTVLIGRQKEGMEVFGHRCVVRALAGERLELSRVQDPPLRRWATSRLWRAAIGI